MTRPLVLGHRGASGYRPELTAGALRLAVEQGADGIEVDVVPTRDGRLAVRHDALLDASTDVIDLLGRDPRTDDLDWSEVARLRARERYPALRPGSAAHDGREPVLQLPEVVRLAEELDVLLVVEIKDAAAFSAVGLDPAPLVARDLAGASCRIVLESFEKTPLDALAGLGHPLVYLIDDEGRAADEDRDYAGELLDPAALARFAGVSLAATLITPARVAAFHGLGLDVWAWTLRPENAFLPAERRIGSDPAAYGDWPGYWADLCAAGVDGVFADHPDLAVTLLREDRAVARRSASLTAAV